MSPTVTGDEEGRVMHPFMSYEVGRQASEERKANALRAFKWRFEPDPIIRNQPSRRRDAEVIEVLFGAQCEVEDAIA
jgi:hypothetical protein